LASGGGKFLGTFQHSMDAKDRVILPSPFRETLMTNTGRLEVYLAPGPGEHPCILAFDTERFDELTDAFGARGFADPEIREFELLFFANTKFCECDGAGRIRIPEYLKELAKIKKEIVIAGASTRFEIWDSESWYRRQEAGWSRFGEFAKKLF
jgi:MraZ protein